MSSDEKRWPRSPTNIARTRVAVRHVRRDGIDVLKKLLKEHAISEDDEKRHEGKCREATDQIIEEIDASGREGKGDHAGLGDRLCPRPHASSPLHFLFGPDASARRHHHGRKRPLGSVARPAAHRGSSARRRGSSRVVRSAIERGVQF